MDSAVITVFNIFFLNKVGVGSVNSAICLLHSESMCMNSAVTIHLRWKNEKKKKKKETWNQKHRCAISQMQLLHSESMCMSSAVTIHTRWKKEKKETWTRNKPNANGHVVMLIFLLDVVELVYNQTWSQNLLIS